MKKIILTVTVVSSLFALSGYDLIEQNGCTACHAIASKKSAPAFAGIARKNLRFYGSEAKYNIINSIKNGSQGKYRNFTNTAMPAFDNISSSDLDIIADFILSQSSKAKGHGGMGRGMHKGRMF